MPKQRLMFRSPPVGVDEPDLGIPEGKDRFPPQVAEEVQRLTESLTLEQLLGRRGSNINLDQRQRKFLDMVKAFDDTSPAVLIRHLLDEVIDGHYPIEGDSYRRLQLRKRGEFILRRAKNKVDDPFGATEDADIFG